MIDSFQAISIQDDSSAEVMRKHSPKARTEGQSSSPRQQSETPGSSAVKRRKQNEQLEKSSDMHMDLQGNIQNGMHHLDDRLEVIWLFRRIALRL